MRYFILASLAAFSVLALAAAQVVQTPPYSFKITDGTTDAPSPCDQNALVAKCASATTWERFTGTHSMQCGKDAVSVSHSWDPDDGAAQNMRFNCETRRGKGGAPYDPFDQVVMAFTVSGQLSSCGDDVPTLTAGSATCEYYYAGTLVQ